MSGGCYRNLYGASLAAVGGRPGACLNRFALRVTFGGMLLSLAWGAHAWPETSQRLTPSKFLAPALQVADASDTDDDTASFYADNVDPGVQQECLLCHKAGGSALQSGARLALSDVSSANHSAFVTLLTHEDVDGDWVLAKVAGRQNHGGGAVLSESSELYQELEEYLVLLGEAAAGQDNLSNFWEGTAPESRESTLRRAVLLFAGAIPSADAVNSAEQSEAGLRQALLSAMSGEGFKDFILRGANDRLLLEGLLNGLNFEISTRDRYPTLSELLSKLPDRRPEEYEDYHDKPFLTDGDADWNFRWAITREPLELIAYVVMNDLPYRQVLTANHTMVNAFSDLAYRADTGFSHEFADEQGFYDRSEYNEFVPGYNDGHIPHDQAFEFQEETGVTEFSDYQEWPHAGVLSTQGWLARYPSTDTNRNRARARWTYLHFLGVDIERSAPRTMDQDALTDTNNPTMNNSACTVCHERLDPVAGAYESFGDLGHYLDQYGGKDSLADSYKCPECYGGDSQSSLYEDGDTWYRDMRLPGFKGKVAGGARDSVQWLGYRMSRDPRFAAATVRFWWPAIFGADPLVVPEDTQMPNYEADRRAFNEQDALIESLAGQFVASGFKARELFADMVMSRWYRHSAVTNQELVDSRPAELATVGRGRLLGPEELDRKNIAVFGRTWRQYDSGLNPHNFSRETALTGIRASFKGFYGGIDGAVVTTRNRDFTPLMANLTESMASELACQIVIEDFNRPRNERLVFQDVDRNTTSSYQARRQIKSLMERAVQRNISLAEESQMLSMVTTAASEAVPRGDWYFDHHSRCDTWMIWPGEELTHDENQRRYGDPQGMMRGWTVLLHGILTSYGYLHD